MCEIVAVTHHLVRIHSIIFSPMCALVLHNPWLLISYYMHDISCNRNIVLYRRYNLVMLVRSLTTTTFASFRRPLHYHIINPL